MSDEQIAVATPQAETATIQEAVPVDTEVITEGEETAQAQAPKPEAPKVEPPSKKKYNVKVNGKEKSLEVGDDEIQTYLQKALAADSKFEEASSMRKQIEAFITDLKANPLNVLRHPELGIDIKSLAEQVLLDELKEAEKSPEQKKLEDMERQLKDYETKAKKLEDEKRDAEVQRIKAEQFQQFDNDIIAALEGTTLPKSPYVVKRITDTLLEAMALTDDKGAPLFPDVAVKDVMQYVEDSIKAEFEQMFQVMPTEMFEKLVGKNHLNNMRKQRVAQSKAKTASLQEIKETNRQEKKDETKQTFDSVFGRF